MSEIFNVQSTSDRSASVEDIWLAPPPDKDAATTRRVLRSTLVDNVNSTEARVKATIVHQRRHNKSDPWQDCDHFDLRKLRAGEYAKIELDAAQTHHLYKILGDLHKITENGIPRTSRNLVVIDESEDVVVSGRHAELIRGLSNKDVGELLDAMQELKPQLLKSFALTKLHQLREDAVRDFQKHLEANDWSEGCWQKFFEQNTWIFGYGLDYRFLSIVTSQPQYGGTLVTGRGGQRGDFLTVTEADRHFTVLVEIKRPDSILVENTLYRNKVHTLNEELTGGVTQVQSNCRTWETQGSREDDNRELLDSSACYTIQPKGILIIGNTNQLDTNAKRVTFELFRRNLQNPVIITFDELLGRAKHLLLKEVQEVEASSQASEANQVSEENSSTEAPPF